MLGRSEANRSWRRLFYGNWKNIALIAVGRGGVRYPNGYSHIRELPFPSGAPGVERLGPVADVKPFRTGAAAPSLHPAHRGAIAIAACAVDKPREELQQVEVVGAQRGELSIRLEGQLLRRAHEPGRVDASGADSGSNG